MKQGVSVYDKWHAYSNVLMQYLHWVKPIHSQANTEKVMF
jgi:hypothetical protein